MQSIKKWPKLFIFSLCSQSRCAVSTNDASSSENASQAQDNKTFACMMASVVACGFFVFANSASGDFVHDDIAAIVNNPDVNGKNLGLWQAFSNDFWGEPMASVRSHKSYRPLTILLFR